jgi:hypothetical protein
MEHSQFDNSCAADKVRSQTRLDFVRALSANEDVGVCSPMDEGVMKRPGARGATPLLLYPSGVGVIRITGYDAHG